MELFKEGLSEEEQLAIFKRMSLSNKTVKEFINRTAATMTMKE